MNIELNQKRSCIVREGHEYFIFRMLPTEKYSEVIEVRRDNPNYFGKVFSSWKDVQDHYPTLRDIDVAWSENVEEGTYIKVEKRKKEKREIYNKDGEIGLLEKIAMIRKAMKKDCKTLSIRNSTGTAYGWIDISGSGEFGRFTEEEIQYLESIELGYGANFANISPDSRDYWLRKLCHVWVCPKCHKAVSADETECPECSKTEESSESEDFWEDAEIIDVSTKEDALRDGEQVLVPICLTIPLGFRAPVYLTRGVYNSLVTGTEQINDIYLLFRLLSQVKNRMKTDLSDWLWPMSFYNEDFFICLDSEGITVMYRSEY